jgi:nitrogenase molybdenum-iron protein alpha/beta subunit
MKTLVIVCALCLSMNNAFAQPETSKEIPVIKVPDFAGAGVKSFYQSYADHLLKCIKAIPEKNESEAKALFKDP